MEPKILIVDDSPTIRGALGRRLGEMGAVVVQAGDGREGLEKAREGGFDLVVTDVEMPHMDGFSLCDALKQHEATRSVPVIILSTLDEEEHVERGFEVGAAAYVTKQTAGESLIRRVREVLEKSTVLRERRILVVDDSPSIRNLVCEALLKAGFLVEIAADGEEALQRLASGSFDLIVSDMNMPRLDGAGLCRAVQSDPKLSAIPFVVMSADKDRSTMRGLVRRGVAGFLVKPFHPDQLVLTVEKLLSDHFLRILHEKQRLEEERSLMLGTIAGLAQALEARDPYTRGHSDEVARIAVAMAGHMGLEDKTIRRLETAARLHDLGKIGISDQLLRKKGRLTDEEYAEIKRHPTLGADILRPIPSLESVLPGVLHHHERFDGGGYPHGLVGEDIPLPARIIAVADVYNALTTNRPYRDPMSEEQTMEIITRDRGTHFCPVCTDAFLELKKKNII